ncbi:MAG TPA: hypothetical protein VFD92_25330 [Candidatus Binatia bacterium]|nr:hypothetical protein [Candidatus Binatia bacterium]
MNCATRLLAALAVIAAVAALSCKAGPEAPRLDASSVEAFDKSMADVQAPLSPEERERFSAAFTAVVRHAIGGGARDVENSPDVRAKVAKAVDGKTAADVIAEGERLRGEPPRHDRQS